MGYKARVHVDIDQAALTEATTGPGSEPVRLVRRVMRNTLNTAKMRAPVDKGILRNSHRMTDLTVRGAVIRGAVVAETDYATFVHDGTRPHEIRPRRKRALSWKGAGGRRRYTRLVQHPGSKPRPWLANAARAEGARYGFTVDTP